MIEIQFLKRISHEKNVRNKPSDIVPGNSLSTDHVSLAEIMLSS